MTAVTVGIPNFNYGRYLPEAVDSVLGQGVDVEIVIVDDASTDDSYAIAEGLAAAHPQIRLYRNDRNLKQIATFNRCLDEAKGSTFYLLSADDMLAPGALARCLKVMRLYPGVGGVYGNAVCVDRFGLTAFGFRKGSEPRLRLDDRPPVLYRHGGWTDEMCRTGRFVLNGSEMLIRTELHRRCRFDETTSYSSDLEMSLRLGMLTDIAYLPGLDIQLYRVHGANMSKSYDFETNLDVIRAAFRKAYAKGALTPKQIEMAETALDARLKRGPRDGWFHKHIGSRIEFYSRARTGVWSQP